MKGDLEHDYITVKKISQMQNPPGVADTYTVFTPTVTKQLKTVCVGVSNDVTKLRNG